MSAAFAALFFYKKYVYDSFGQLIRENNKALDKTYIYSYNEFGNIVSAESFAYTTGDVTPGTGTTQSYSYNTTHPDRLTSFGGKAISYNINGCPISYDGKSYTWNRGKLARIHRGSSAQVGALYEYCNFSYDGYGRRVSKSYSYDSNPASTSDYSYSYNTTYEYDTSGRLIHEKCIESYTYTGGTSRTREITYLYDESGIIGAVQTYNNATETFYFDRNLLGDVIGIYNSSGTKIASYTYDAFGNCTTKALVANTFSAYNPIRYRGYYYDRETKLYYLNARYYNPEWRRFISPDDTAYLDPESINGLNLYAYCYNDPVNYADPSGHVPEWLKNLLTGVGIIVGTALFVTAIIASAGAVGALVGVGAAAIGLSTTAVSTAITIATVSTYVVAGGVGLFGASDAIEVFSGGVNPIRDYVMGGNQTAYNITNGVFNILGTIAVIAGMIGPKVLQKIAQPGGTPKVSNGKTVGHAKDFFDKKGNWSYRIDATTHGNPNAASWHHNPHYHVVTRGGDGTAVYYLWEIIKEMLKKKL